MLTRAHISWRIIKSGLRSLECMLSTVTATGTNLSEDVLGIAAHILCYLLAAK